MSHYPLLKKISFLLSSLNPVSPPAPQLCVSPLAPPLISFLHSFLSPSSLLAEPQVIQYLLTSLFANISSAEVSCVALVGDIAILTLDPANWSIHFHWPWVSQAAAEVDGEKMMSQYKIALRNMIRFVHDTVQQTKQHCE